MRACQKLFELKSIFLFARELHFLYSVPRCLVSLFSLEVIIVTVILSFFFQNPYTVQCGVKWVQTFEFGLGMLKFGLEVHPRRVVRKRSWNIIRAGNRAGIV